MRARLMEGSATVLRQLPVRMWKLLVVFSSWKMLPWFCRGQAVEEGWGLSECGRLFWRCSTGRGDGAPTLQAQTQARPVR